MNGINWNESYSHNTLYEALEKSDSTEHFSLYSVLFLLLRNFMDQNGTTKV